jgi:CheY-like chemotaxis protein
MAAILIVEDDRDNAELAREAMAQSGHDTRIVTDGAAALDAARRWHPDLILLDVSLDGPLTGLHVCEAVRADPGLAAIPVVMLSGWAFDTDLGAGRTAGADACLAKPFRPSQLQAVVQALLANRSGYLST